MGPFAEVNLLLIDIIFILPGTGNLDEQWCNFGLQLATSSATLENPLHQTFIIINQNSLCTLLFISESASSNHKTLLDIEFCGSNGEDYRILVLG